MLAANTKPSTSNILDIGPSTPVIALGVATVSECVVG
jgi:hypothetical protein